jgi:ubiquinone/menaquinone biosynthesis C-methylase UbiE
MYQMPSTPPPREHVACNLCDSSDSAVWATVAGATVVRCLRCGLVYTDPRPVLEALMNCYEAEYSIQHQDQELLRQRRLMYEVERRDLLKRVPGGRFLDVGCGTGEFLAALAEDFDVYGVDVSRTYIEYGRDKLGLTNLHVGQLSSARFADDFFDVVQMRGVLQHVPDPLGQLREAHRVLKPGGLLLITATPNIASPAARAFRGNFRLLAPDQMLYNFSPKTMREMLKKAGFAVDTFTFPYFSTPYWHWWDGFSFVALLLRLKFRHLTGGDTSAIKSPPFPHNMMNCYARKSHAR